MDMTAKYGIGYQLSNGTFGAYFNDGSKILDVGNGLEFYYFERAFNQIQQDKVDVQFLYNFVEFPKEIEKKVVLIKYFKDKISQKQNSKNIKEESCSDPVVYVKKWMQTRHAMVFRLSNKIIHLIFTDKSELVLNSVPRTVLYVDKN